MHESDIYVYLYLCLYRLYGNRGSSGSTRPVIIYYKEIFGTNASETTIQNNGFKQIYVRVAVNNEQKPFCKFRYKRPGHE